MPPRCCSEARLAERPTPRTLDFEPLLADRFVGAEVVGRALEDDAAAAHHVDPARDRQRDGELLLDEQDGDAVLSPIDKVILFDNNLGE